MKILRNIFLSIILLQSSTSLSFATDGGAGAAQLAVQIQDFALQQVGVAKDAAAFALDNKDNVKEFVLDPAARVLGQKMIQEMQKSTINWINTGLDGNGPSFIANPKIFFRNVANEEIRIQLSTLDKNSVLGQTVAGSVIASVRGDRATVGAKITSTLPSDIQRSICNDATITELARAQVTSGIGTRDQTGLSQEAKLAQAKQSIYQDLCSADALSNKAIQQKLLACFKNDVRCGGWGAILASFDPKNTEYGQAALAQIAINQATNLAVAELQAQISDGIAPKRKCRARLEVDDDGNRYATPEAAPCINWTTETPTAQIKTVLTQAVQGDFSGLQDADEISEVITGLAVSQLTGMFTTAIQSSLNGAGSNSNKDTLFDDPRYRGALPPSLVETKEPGTSLPTISQADQVIIDRAKLLCADKKGNYSLYKRFCSNLDSNTAAEQPYTKYLENIDGYSKVVDALGVCVAVVREKVPQPDKFDDWAEIYEDRKVKVDIEKRKTTQVVDGLPTSMLTLSKYIVLLEDKGESLLTQVLDEYGNAINDNLIVLPGVEEGVYEQAQQLKQQADKDTGKKGDLAKAINACRPSAGQCKIVGRTGLCIQYGVPEASPTPTATTTPENPEGLGS